MEKIIIRSEKSGIRLDSYLSEKTEYTRSAIQRIMEEGGVTVNGKVRDKKYKVEMGDEIELIPPKPIPTEAKAEDIPIEILYEDEAFAIVNKPKGMVVHPAPGNYEGTMVNALLHALEGRLSGINGVIRPGIVHRIDKDTSGILIVAKNDSSHLALAEQIKEHSFDRVYHAVVVGNLKEDSGTVEGNIGRNPKNRLKMAITADGKPARTHYRVLERFDGACYVECKLETGRTHQIRVHMSSLGHPLYGDELYGGGNTEFEKKNKKILEGQCLHAKYIGFAHPTTGEWVEFDSELPDYFKNILKKLREGKR